MGCHGTPFTSGKEEEAAEAAEGDVAPPSGSSRGNYSDES